MIYSGIALPEKTPLLKNARDKWGLSKYAGKTYNKERQRRRTPNLGIGPKGRRGVFPRDTPPNW